MTRVDGQWRPAESHTLALTFVVGTLLVVNPLYLGYINVGQWGYGYEARPVTVEQGRVAVEEEWPPDHSFAGIACSGFVQSYECAYQYARFADGRYPVTLPVEVAAFDGPRYVYQYGENGSIGRYYRRTIDDTDAGLSIRVEPVSPTAVLQNASVPPSRLSLAGRWALLTGHVQTQHPLPMANRIIATDDGYVVLERTRTPRDRPNFVWTLTAAGGVLAGLGLLRTGYRQLAAR